MMATKAKSEDEKKTLAYVCVNSLWNCNSMSFHTDEDEDNERMPMKKSLEDLPTDDSESVGSITRSSDDEDDLASGDETEPHTNLTVNNKARRSYEEASSSSSSDGSSEDSSDDSSNSSDDDDDDDEIEEQVTNRQHQIQQFHNDSGSESSEQEDDLQNVPLEERIRKRQEEGLSKSARAAAAAKRRQRAMSSHQALQIASRRLKPETPEATDPKKKSKHRPTEVSSKRSDFFKRGAPTLDSSGLGVEITAHLYKPRDPRILGATSKSTAAVDSNYAFVQELRQKEISLLKKKIAVQKLTGKKGQRARRKMNLQRDSLKHDQEELKRLLQEKAGYERAQVDLAAKRAVKQKMKQQVESGKGVYYLKKREMKKLHLEAKYEELRKRGGEKAVDKALAKRRKKNKSKDTGYFIPKNV